MAVRRAAAHVGWPTHSSRSIRPSVLMPASIAIIDDDVDVRESTRQLLRSRGYLTVAFASAEEFLKSEKAAQVNCIVSDVRMPGMGGVGLQARLIDRGQPHTDHFCYGISRTEGAGPGACGGRVRLSDQAVCRSKLDQLHRDGIETLAGNDASEIARSRANRRNTPDDSVRLTKARPFSRSYRD